MSKNSTKNNQTIFVGGLPGSVRREQLHKYFEQFGKIKKMWTVKNSKKVNLSKGYALVTFETQEAYTAALSRHEHLLYGRTIQCQPHLKGAQLTKYLHNLNSRRIHVKNIPREIDNTAFRKIFIKFGEIDFCYTIKNPKTQVSKGFGYVAYKDQETAKYVASFGFVEIGHGIKLAVSPYKIRGTENYPEQDRQPFRSSPNIEWRNETENSYPVRQPFKDPRHYLQKKNTIDYTSTLHINRRLNNEQSPSNYRRFHTIQDNSNYRYLVKSCSYKPTDSTWFKNRPKGVYFHDSANLKFNPCYNRTLISHVKSNPPRAKQSSIVRFSKNYQLNESIKIQNNAVN